MYYFILVNSIAYLAEYFVKLYNFYITEYCQNTEKIDIHNSCIGK